MQTVNRFNELCEKYADLKVPQEETGGFCICQVSGSISRLDLKNEHCSERLSTVKKFYGDGYNQLKHPNHERKLSVVA